MPEFLALVEQDTVVQAKLFITSLASPDFYGEPQYQGHSMFFTGVQGTKVLFLVQMLLGTRGPGNKIELRSEFRFRSVL